MASHDHPILRDQIADTLARSYDGTPLADLREEHAEHHQEAASAVLADLGGLEVGVYRVALLPAGHPMREFAAISVRLRDSGRWQVDRLGFLLGADGRWEQGARRTPEWHVEREYGLSTALTMARQAAPHIRVGDVTVGDLLQEAPAFDGALFAL